MWDRGYKVGHSVRSISDIKKISKKDLKELKEEGIEAQIIPWIEDKDN